MKIDQTLFVELATLARNAGLAAIEIYQKEDFGVQLKKDNSPVTAADLKVNQILSEGLAKLTPSIPIISEEANVPYQGRKDYGRFWIIDPIDGTKEFIKRSGEFTVNLGLVEKIDRVKQDALVKPTFGIIYIPVSDELFIGGQELGLINLNSENDNSVARWTGTEYSAKAFYMRGEVGKTRTLPLVTRVMGREDKLILTCSKDHNRPEDFDFIHNLSRDFYCKLLPCGSTIKICRIAQGNADVYIRSSGINDWDLAAGQAIVEAAGGSVTTLDGKELVYNTESQRLLPFIVHGRIDSNLGGAAYHFNNLDWRRWTN